MQTNENCEFRGNNLRSKKKLAEKKLAIGENADEFVEIGEADGFKLYVIAGKTLKDEVPISFHENPRDVLCWCSKGK